MGIEPMTTRCLVVALTTKLLGHLLKLVAPHQHGHPLGDDDDELNINPPTPCRFGKHPPAPENWPAIEERAVERN